MKKAHYKYRLEVNRWTWVAGASALIFLGILLVQILRDPPIFVTNVEVETPPELIVVDPVGFYDPTAGTEPYYGMSGPPAGPETSYEAPVPFWLLEDEGKSSAALDGAEEALHMLEEEWHPPDLLTAAPEYALEPIMAEEVAEEAAEATAAQKTLIERILELISQILDKLMQLTTATIIIMGIWKSIKREE